MAVDNHSPPNRLTSGDVLEEQLRSRPTYASAPTVAKQAQTRIAAREAQARAGISGHFKAFCKRCAAHEPLPFRLEPIQLSSGMEIACLALLTSPAGEQSARCRSWSVGGLSTSWLAGRHRWINMWFTTGHGHL